MAERDDSRPVWEGATIERRPMRDIAVGDFVVSRNGKSYTEVRGTGRGNLAPGTTETLRLLFDCYGEPFEEAADDVMIPVLVED